MGAQMLELIETPEQSEDRAEREREMLQLRLASPKRAGPGRIVLDQEDAAHLPLFVAANEPRLF